MKKLIYTIVLLAGFQLAYGQVVVATLFYNPGPPVSLSDSIGLPMPDQGMAYNASIILYTYNASDETFPVGTVFTYEVVIGNSQPFTVSDTLPSILEKDSMVFSKYYYTRQIGPHNSSLGDNEICAEIIKVDGANFSNSISICAIYTFTNPVGIADIDVLRNVKVYPNPVRNNLKIENLQGNTNISIYNITGQLIQAVSSVMGNTEIDMSGFSNGLYFVKLQNGQNVRTEKIQVVK